jgi:hypothetical protein
MIPEPATSSEALVAECLVIINNPSSSFEENKTAILSLSINGLGNQATNSLVSLLGYPDRAELFKLYNTAAHCLNAAGQQDSAKHLWKYVLNSSITPFQQVLDAAMRLNAINDENDCSIRQKLLIFMTRPFLRADDFLGIAHQINSLRGFSDLAVEAYKKVIDHNNATSSQLKTAAIQLTELARNIPIGNDSTTLAGKDAAVLAWDSFISRP